MSIEDWAGKLRIEVARVISNPADREKVLSVPHYNLGGNSLLQTATSESGYNAAMSVFRAAYAAQLAPRGC